ncbi:siroheme synthase CysG [Methylicorpusculum sp.]|uniref:siroheme synthase CysG n=1 Tax=Methylicorpusculum sp. TaxID=2713644 RepID=UPI002AB9A959|nr:siroheme synthase CysG [Methylicorpusculum sp.]MDZ4151102.1 siroheme synthase CysG [Methylicorpusculum sp.]
MDYFPLFIKLHGQPCLIIGAGGIAARKIELLASAGAKITVVALEFTDSVHEMQAKYQLTLLQKPFEQNDVNGFKLVVSATDNTETNHAVAEAAYAQDILVNVVDNPALCNFIFPAIVDRSPIIAAISSGGASPVLSRLLRARIESMIPYQYGKLAQLAETFRQEVKNAIQQPAQRRIFWESVLQGKIAELVFAGHKQEAEENLRQAIAEASAQTTLSGEVYLVGAGPGDPDLLTFRALRLMQQADVVVYDRLVSPAILDLVRRDATKLYVGKQRNNHSMPQASINNLLIDLAKQGKRVVRLKGGDPFIFGRGGEEIATLMEQGINFQVVPGITAASGCSTYAGIPLTHRDYAQSVTFVTGHLKDDAIDLNWDQLAAPNQTLVIYMGLLGLPKICATLIAHGASKDLPIALIEQGTMVQQQVFTGTLTTLPEMIKPQTIRPPTLVIIGTVVSLRSQLKWFNETTFSD